MRAVGLALLLSPAFVLAGCACNEDQDADGDGFSTTEGDCDDEDALVYPGADESCNGIDDDCDSSIDEDFDADSDTYFDSDSCADGTDCDDTNDEFFPGAVELCDGLDNDCDGVADNGLTPRLWCEDGDGDGVGSDVSVEVCEDTAPIGYVECPTDDYDCDDSAGTIFPGATEACNGLDDDCNGLADFDAAGEVDVDTDGALSCADCDDDEAASFPGNPELCDALDNDCNGTADFSNANGDEFDGDGDGYIACAECDDSSAPVYPGAGEACDALDTNCDGSVDPEEIDGDGDGWIDCSNWVPNGAVGIFGGDDCDDADPSVYPTAAELCDGVNQDCDEFIDEDFDADGDGHFDENDLSCANTYSQDELDCDETAYTVYYGAPEVCDDADNDCDGLEDGADPDYLGSDGDGDGEDGIFCGGTDCNDGDPQMYATWSADSDGYSPCAGDCDDLDPYVHPNQNEACDGVDTDCDGDIDSGDLDLASDWDGDGQVASGCGLGGTDCDDRDPHVFEVDSYTSGMIPTCAPAVYPGFDHQWNYGRISLPSYFQDPTDGLHYLYYRGHHNQSDQMIGVSLSTNGADWSPSAEAVLEDTGEDGGWDNRNMSNPTVAYVPGLLRPYVMLYHARAVSGGLRQIGLATATDPLGPFERRDPNTGADLPDAPVIAPSVDASAQDNGRTLHPSIYFDGTDLHVWYNGRQGSPNTLRVFHALSSDGGVTWTKTDDDNDGLVDAIFEPGEVWHGTSVSQVSWLEDPVNTGEFEFWYTGSSTQVGHTTGTLTSWDSGTEDPVLSAGAECTRMDGYAVSARGVRHDLPTDTYYWYYGSQTDMRDPITLGGTCQDNFDNFVDDPLWNNGGYLSYVSQGTNYAPSATINVPSTLGADMTLDGTVTDSAPDDGNLVVTVSSDIDGPLGEATITPTGNTDPGVQTTAWTLSVTGVSGGAHVVTVDVVDGAGTARSTSLSLVVP